MYSYGKGSTAVYNTLHPVLQELCGRVIKKRDISLLVGHRGKEEQNLAFSRNVSTKQWPDSKHNHYPSMAVDAAPYPIPDEWGDLDGQTLKARDLNWKERVKFYEMCASFEDSWHEMCDLDSSLSSKYKLRFGKDWNGDGDYRDQSFDDLPHIELTALQNGA